MLLFLYLHKFTFVWLNCFVFVVSFFEAYGRQFYFYLHPILNWYRLWLHGTSAYEWETDFYNSRLTYIHKCFGFRFNFILFALIRTICHLHQKTHIIFSAPNENKLTSRFMLFPFSTKMFIFRCSCRQKLWVCIAKVYWPTCS